MLDAAAGGTLIRKMPEEAYDLLEEMASNSYQWQCERGSAKKAAGVHNVDTYTALSAQIEALTKKIDGMSAPIMKVQAMQCELCGGGHQSMDCQVGNPFAQSAEQANYVNNFRGQPNNPYSGTYNPGWRNHPNFSWSNNQGAARPPPGFQHPPPP